MYCLRNKYSVTIVGLLAVLIPNLFINLSLAATTNLNVVINPGSLSLTNPSLATISAVTLEGTAQSSTGSLGAVTVVDNRGTGAGWSITLSVSNFTCCSPTQTIGAENLTVNPGGLTVVSGSSGGVTAGSARTIVSTSDSVTLMTAVSGSGLGSYRTNPSLALNIPGNTYAGTYTATVTITVI